MRGVFVHKPLEWQIDVQGESWAQGEIVQGSLSVKNLGSDTLALSGGGVKLALADIKKVHSRASGAFKVESEALFTQEALAPGESTTLPFQFTLPPNCAVTDKKASYYVVWGPQGLDANLQLNIGPQKLFTEITRLMETFQRFKPKDIKASKGAVEFKLVPPTSRDYAHVEALLLEQRLEGDQLQLSFTFKVKTLVNAAVVTSISKEEKTFSKTLTPREYSLGRGMLNQEGVLKALDEVLSQIKMKGF